MGCAVSTFTSVVAYVSILGGMCFYVNGMTKDLRMRLEAIVLDSSDVAYRQASHQAKIWSIYVREIVFHTKIIK